jgi:hypothetical protein
VLRALSYRLLASSSLNAAGSLSKPTNAVIRGNGAQSACDVLIALTIERGATDNVTVVIVRYDYGSGTLSEAVPAVCRIDSPVFHPFRLFYAVKREGIDFGASLDLSARQIEAGHSS